MTPAELVARVKQHTAQFEHLRTFQQVHVWDACGTRVIAIAENAGWRSPKTRDGDRRKRGMAITENAHRDRRSNQFA